MYFDYDLPVGSIILLSLALACVVYLCAVYCRKLYIIRRHKRVCDSREPVDAGKLPKASIVIYTRCEPEALARNLPAILSQDYPSGYEVVVVNEGASPETSMVVGELKLLHPNLYLTYTPDGARNLSRKKLALTLGIKASKGEVVVITDATTKVASDKWLASLLSQFAKPGVEVVLGYGINSLAASAGHTTRAFDVDADNAAWLSSAIAGKPYRGCGFNLAYKRELFFANKGFSRSLNLRDGDDDIFVNEITTGANTAVELSSPSMVGREAMPYKRVTGDERLSHAFTGKRLPRGSRRAMALGEWCLWLVAGFSVAGILLAGYSNAFALALGLMLVLGAFIPVVVSWQRTQKTLGSKPATWALPALIPTRPLRNAMVTLRSRLAKTGHYTWQ